MDGYWRYSRHCYKPKTPVLFHQHKEDFRLAIVYNSLKNQQQDQQWQNSRSKHSQAPVIFETGC